MTVISPAPAPQGTVTVTTTATPHPVPTTPAAADTIGLGSWLSIVLSATVMASLITGSITLWLARIRSHAEERARLRNTFAEAFQAYADYREMPYAVRRRDATKPAEERRRLSDELRTVQSRLSYYETWIAIEAPKVAETYSKMIKQLRIVAGGAMRESWKTTGLDADVDMNIPATIVDLSSLSPYEAMYRAAVASHLTRRSRCRRKHRPQSRRRPDKDLPAPGTDQG
jgi:hypothetical protein